MRFASSSAKPPFSNESSGYSEEDEDAGAPSSSASLRMKSAPQSIPPTRSMPISIPQPGSASSPSPRHSTGSSLGAKRITSASSLRSMLFPAPSPSPSPSPSLLVSTSPKGEDALRHVCGSPPASNNPLRRLSRSLRSFEDFSHLSPAPTPPQSPTAAANEQRLLRLIPHTSQVRDLINTLVMGHDSESSKQVRFLFYVWQFETEPNPAKQRQMASGIVETFLHPQSAFRLGGIPRDLAKCTADNLGALKLHFLGVLASNAAVVDFLDAQDLGPGGGEDGNDDEDEDNDDDEEGVYM